MANRIYKTGDKVHTYVITKEINRGMMALSYAAKANDGRTIFLKQYKSPTVLIGWYRAYIAYQQEMKRRIERPPCQNFCYRFLDSFEFHRCYFQVFEFLDRSNSLQEILDKCRLRPSHAAPEQRLLMAKVLLSGMNALHKANIIHSDLKPENIMLIKDSTIAMGYRLKLIDMDFSLLVDRKAPWHGDRGYFGTAGYLSPEHIRGEVPQTASDAFTLGLIVHEVLGGQHPYRTDDEDVYRKDILAHRARPLNLIGNLAKLPNAPSIVQMIHRCLHPDPRLRPTALEVNQVLNGRAVIPLRHALVPKPVEIIVSPGKTDTRAEDALHDTKVIPPAVANRKLVLRNATGDEKAFTVGTTLGSALVRSFGEEAQFVAELQFVLERDDSGWYVLPHSEVKNETVLNGKRLEGRTRLREGDILGVGRAAKGIIKLPLTVSFR